jgi:hypothetical protein
VVVDSSGPVVVSPKVTLTRTLELKSISTVPFSEQVANPVPQKKLWDACENVSRLPSLEPLRFPLKPDTVLVWLDPGTVVVPNMGSVHVTA